MNFKARLSNTGAKYRFMSFQGAKNTTISICLIVGMVVVAKWIYKKTEVQRASLVSAAGGLFSATGSSTIEGARKYLAPESTQQQSVVRKSIGLYTNQA